MKEEPEKDLDQALRETPWSAIVLPFVIAIVVVITVLAAVAFGQALN